MRHAALAILAGATVLAGAGHAQLPAVRAPVVLESFGDASRFRAVPSDGVTLALRADSGIAGAALRMDYDYHGHAGYAVARTAFAMPALPPYFAITLWVRGEALPNTLELKLVDSTGQNVWWMRKPDLAVTAGWTRLRFRPSDLAFAWGPLGGGPPRGIAALEIAFTAGQGGRGWLAIDDLVLTPLAPPVAESRRPGVSASSTASGSDPRRVIGPGFYRSPTGPAPVAAAWASGADGAQWISLDFGGTRQLSALVLDWSTTDWPVDYDLESSVDGRRWATLREVRGSAGGRRFVHVPFTELAQLRIAMRRSSRGRGYSLGGVRVLSDSAAGSRSAFLERVAAASPAGTWPRPLTGQQSYWTIIGLPRDERDALVSEDGNVESMPGGFSVEPFLLVDGHLLTWREGTPTHTLDGGTRPIPTVQRTARELTLATIAFVDGPPGSSVLWVRYRVINHASRARRVVLSAVVRPVQVNPPWQFLGVAGGAASIGTIQVDQESVVVNSDEHVVAVTRPSTARLATFDGGGIVGELARDAVETGLPAPVRRTLRDPTGFAEGALSWLLALGAHDSADVWIALPEPGSVSASQPRPPVLDAVRASALGDDHLRRVRSLWDHELGDLLVDLPGDGAPIARTLQSALGYILINARGPAIQPGTRSYRRSWIRDGALTSSALMRLGHTADARAFLDWYVPRVFADGKVPCCVDGRGSDPVTENDADGELLYLAAEYLRMSGDTATVARHWPTLGRVAVHLDSLRNSRRTAQYRTPDSLIVFGLLPPSISHEGYSAKPAYSYWDDWWGVRGLDDAGLLARAMHDPSALRFARAGREMRADVVASVARAMARFHQQTMPGAAELGDTDPTSSTIALEPAQALADLPRHAVEATFDSAWTTLQRRLAPGSRWDIFVPYEWRDVGAYVRLGQPERADAYSKWLMESRRPEGWNEWSEAVWREPRTPKFIGDMPHGWVLSDFVRATLDRLAYEREHDSTLVVGAGIPFAWAHAATGVTVRGVHTWWGQLALSMRPRGANVRIDIAGVFPPGGIEVHAPFGRVPRAVTVNGAPAALTDGGRAVSIRAPAVVEFVY